MADVLCCVMPKVPLVSGPVIPEGCFIKDH